MFRNLKNRAPVEAKRLFLQNRRFRFKSKNLSTNHRFSTSQIDEKLKKIVKKTCLKTCWLLTSIFNDFGSILPPKLEAKKVVAPTLGTHFLQDMPNMGPRVPQERPKSVPRAPQEHPRVPIIPQDCPKSGPKAP